MEKEKKQCSRRRTSSVSIDRVDRANGNGKCAIMRVRQADVDSMLLLQLQLPLPQCNSSRWHNECFCSCSCSKQFTLTSALLPNRTLWPKTFRCALSSSSGRSLSVAARTTESYTPPHSPPTQLPSFPLLFLCYIFLFVALLKLSTRNAPSRFCKSNQNRNQMQIGIRLVCLRSLKRCITLYPSLVHSLSGGFNFKLDRHTVAGRSCGWDGLRNCCENCDRFFTSPD